MAKNSSSRSNTEKLTDRNMRSTTASRCAGRAHVAKNPRAESKAGGDDKVLTAYGIADIGTLVCYRSDNGTFSFQKYETTHQITPKTKSEEDARSCGPVTNSDMILPKLKRAKRGKKEMSGTVAVITLDGNPANRATGQPSPVSRVPI